MIFYLLANNKDINNDHIDQICFDNSVLILFNYMYPMIKFDKVKDHPKISILQTA